MLSNGPRISSLQCHRVLDHTHGKCCLHNEFHTGLHSSAFTKCVQLARGNLELLFPPALRFPHTPWAPWKRGRTGRREREKEEDRERAISITEWSNPLLNGKLVGWDRKWAQSITEWSLCTVFVFVCVCVCWKSISVSNYPTAFRIQSESLTTSRNQSFNFLSSGIGEKVEEIKTEQICVCVSERERWEKVRERKENRRTKTKNLMHGRR